MNKSDKCKDVDQNKRDFVKKAAYTAPVIMTMAAAPSFAGTGSGYPGGIGSDRPGQPRPLSFSPHRNRGSNRDGRSR